MEFCAEMMKRFDENNNFFNWIIFSDEANYMDLSIDTIADLTSACLRACVRACVCAYVYVCVRVCASQ